MYIVLHKFTDTLGGTVHCSSSKSTTLLVLGALNTADTHEALKDSSAKGSDGIAIRPISQTSDVRTSLHKEFGKCDILLVVVHANHSKHNSVSEGAGSKQGAWTELSSIIPSLLGLFQQKMFAG